MAWKLQERLTRSGLLVPIVFLTGTAISHERAGHQGPAPWIFSPSRSRTPTSCAPCVPALQRATEQRDLITEVASLRQRYASLTPPESEVMALVVAGQLNKQIAANPRHGRAHDQSASRPSGWRRWGCSSRRSRSRRGNDWTGKEVVSGPVARRRWRAVFHVPPDTFPSICHLSLVPSRM